MMRWAGMRLSLWLAVLITSVALSVAAQAQGANPDRVALVIGNSKYTNVDALPNPANDARVIAQTLRDIGFAVTDGYDLSRDAMERQIRTFLRQSETAQVRLLYYAGHGLQVDDRNYLVPVDTRLERASDLSFETVGLDTIMENLDSPSRTNIILLDACRNNPFAKAFKGAAGRSFAVQRGLAPSNPGGGTLIAFSTKPGAVALDGDGANSPFTEALARHLRTPGLEVRQMLTRVRADVISATRGEQYPWDNSGLLSDVYLAGLGKGDGGPAARPAAPPAPAADEIHWGVIKDSTVAAVFDEFVNKFPASVHARAARARAEELKKDEQKKTSVAMLPPGPGAQIGKLANAPVNAPIAAFSRSNSGWSAYFSFVDPVLAVSWRLGETGDFRETGFQNAFDPRTRKRMPNLGIQLDKDQKAATIYVRYVDINGSLQGPFPIRFEPAEALERDQRNILEMTAGSWMEFRDFNGSQLLYYTHLVSYRCAIRQVRISLDSTDPDKTIALPPCNEKDPMEVPYGAPLYMKVPPATRSVSVKLTYRDGTESEIKTFLRR
jgi:uncharacterized caspase-like protein